MKRTATLMLTGALVAAACSGSEPTTTTTTPQTTTTAPTTTTSSTTATTQPPTTTTTVVTVYDVKSVDMATFQGWVDAGTIPQEYWDAATDDCRSAVLALSHNAQILSVGIIDALEVVAAAQDGDVPVADAALAFSQYEATLVPATAIAATVAMRPSLGGAADYGSEMEAALRSLIFETLGFSSFVLEDDVIDDVALEVWVPIDSADALIALSLRRPSNYC